MRKAVIYIPATIDSKTNTTGRQALRFITIFRLLHYSYGKIL